MLDKVAEHGDAWQYVKDLLDRTERLMGFGHRVYRAEDPRARVLRRTARELQSPRLAVAEALETAALAELRERHPTACWRPTWSSGPPWCSTSRKCRCRCSSPCSRERASAAGRRSGYAAARAATRPKPPWRASPVSLPSWRSGPRLTLRGCWPTPAGAASGEEQGGGAREVRRDRRSRSPAPRPVKAGGQRPHRAARRHPQVRRSDPAAARGYHPAGAARRVSLHDPDAGPITKGQLGKPIQFGYKAQVVDNDDGVVPDHNLDQGNPADAPQLAPAITRVISRTGRRARTVTADRGYREKTVDDALHDLGVRTVVIPRKGNPARPDKPRNTDQRSARP